jgi:hypothetical protein
MSRFVALLPLLVALAAPGPACGEDPKGPGVMDVVRRHVVTVSLRFQKDLVAEERDAVAPDPRSRSERYRFWRMSYVVPGFVIRDRRTVVASDLWLPPGSIASVTLKPVDGPPVAGRLRGFLRRAEAVVFEAESDLAAEPVPFPETVEVGPSTPLLVGSLAEGAKGMELWAEALGGTRRRAADGSGFAYGHPEAATQGLGGAGEESVRTVDLVLDAKANPVGFRFGGAVDLHESVWTGPRVLADEEIAFQDLCAREECLAKESARHRVTVTFRTVSRDEREESPFSMGEEGGGESELWGLAVSKDLLLVPGRLEPDQVKKIESVRLKDDDEGPGIEASYAGKVRGYDAFLVSVPSGALVPLLAEAPRPPVVGEAVLVHQTSWRGGARRDQLEYDRVLGKGRGYADREFLAVEREVPEGALLLDVEGRALGFAARLDPEDQEKGLGGENRMMRRTRPVFPLVAVMFSDGITPASLAKDPDVTAVPQEEAASKRLPWLGVEYDPIDKGVAELLGVSSPTRDGRRGLIVSRVYEGSPAARAGLREGDVLLSARRASGAGSDAPPVDLMDREAGGGGFFPGFSFGGMGDAAPAPWRAQAGALVRLLKAWGEGTSYELVWLRDGATKSGSFRVENAPPDYASAPRARDRLTGMNVRDVTYEVRAALRMPSDATGVVVARVEPGSPGAQARIEENELVLELDGALVEGANAFVAKLDAARAAGRSQVRLVVRRLDKTRLVDLSLAPSDERAPTAGPGDPPDEGDGDGGNGER